MEITVNQQNYLVPEVCSVQQLILEILQQSPKGLAIAINQTIVPKTTWDKHLLYPGDHLILIKATQGG